MSHYFLDTDTCIFALKARSDILKKRLIGQSPERLKIPSIVKAELLLGAYKSSKPKETLEIVEHFLAPFQIIPFDDACAASYADIRNHLENKGKKIGPNDLIIAATVMEHRGILVTHNAKEFSRVPRLPVEDWTK